MVEATSAEAAAAEVTAVAAIGNILDNVGAVAGAIVAAKDYLGAEVDGGGCRGRAINNVLDNVGALAGAITAADNDLGAELDAVATPPWLWGGQQCGPLGCGGGGQPRCQRDGRGGGSGSHRNFLNRGVLLS